LITESLSDKITALQISRSPLISGLPRRFFSSNGSDFIPRITLSDNLSADFSESGGQSLSESSGVSSGQSLSEPSGTRSIGLDIGSLSFIGVFGGGISSGGLGLGLSSDNRLSSSGLGSGDFPEVLDSFLTSSGSSGHSLLTV